MRLAAIAIMALPLFGQERAIDAYRASQLAFAAGATADIASSFGRTELNPILGRGQFGTQQAGRSIAISAGALLAGELIARKWPRSRKLLTWVNFASAGVRFGAAGRNWAQ